MAVKEQPPRRNTRNIGFSEEEYKEIAAKAQKMGIYPRQYIMFKIRGTK